MVLIFLSSCNAIIERILSDKPDNDEFRYYQKTETPIINKNLNTTDFYYRKTSGPWEYLAFKSDGTVILFDHTAMVPDTVHYYTGIMNPKRKKNKRPKDLKDDFGYFITKGDSIFFTIHQELVFSSKLYEYNGIIFKDSLFLHRKNIPLYETDYETKEDSLWFYFYKKD